MLYRTWAWNRKKYTANCTGKNLSQCSALLFLMRLSHLIRQYQLQKVGAVTPRSFFHCTLHAPNAMQQSALARMCSVQPNGSFLLFGTARCNNELLTLFWEIASEAPYLTSIQAPPMWGRSTWSKQKNYTYVRFTCACKVKEGRETYIIRFKVLAYAKK